MDKKTKNIVIAASGVVAIALAAFIGYKYCCGTCCKGDGKKSEDN